MNSTEVQNPRASFMLIIIGLGDWRFYQWLLCLLYVLCAAVACIKSVEMFQKISCLPYVFDSVLACAKPAHARVSEALLPALRTLSLSFLTNSSSVNKAFQHFIAFSGSPIAVRSAILFFDMKAWPQSQTDLFTCTTVLHCGHTFLTRIDLIYVYYSIPS